MPALTRMRVATSVSCRMRLRGCSGADSRAMHACHRVPVTWSGMYMAGVPLTRRGRQACLWLQEATEGVCMAPMRECGPVCAV